MNRIRGTGYPREWWKSAHAAGALVKVIIETALLTDEEKVIACLLAKEAGADFVKTSTGFSGGGATVHDIELMRKTVGPNIGVKASGGIHTHEDAEALVAAGATRIGASAGVKIIQASAAEPKSNSCCCTCTCQKVIEPGVNYAYRPCDRNNRFNHQR